MAACWAPSRSRPLPSSAATFGHDRSDDLLRVRQGEPADGSRRRQPDGDADVRPGRSASDQPRGPTLPAGRAGATSCRLRSRCSRRPTRRWRALFVLPWKRAAALARWRRRWWARGCVSYHRPRCSPSPSRSASSPARRGPPDDRPHPQPLLLSDRPARRVELHGTPRSARKRPSSMTPTSTRRRSHGLPPALVILSFVTGLIVAFLVKTWAPELGARRSGGDGRDPLQARQDPRRGRRPDPRSSFSIGLARSAARGAHQTGSTFGSLVGVALRSVPQRDADRACAAGGIAATFNTPIGGMVFAVELMPRVQLAHAHAARRDRRRRDLRRPLHAVAHRRSTSASGRRRRRRSTGHRAAHLPPLAWSASSPSSLSRASTGPRTSSSRSPATTTRATARHARAGRPHMVHAHFSATTTSKASVTRRSRTSSRGSPSVTTPTPPPPPAGGHGGGYNGYDGVHVPPGGFDGGYISNPTFCLPPRPSSRAPA